LHHAKNVANYDAFSPYRSLVKESVMIMFSLARFLRRCRTYRIVFEARASYSEYELPTSGLIVPIFAISPAADRKNRPRLGRPEAPPEPDVRF
jgi:hypothetical protein